MRKKNALFSDVNMVPYLDVMLVLLIIFMIVTPVVHMGVQVSLPRASAQPLSNVQEAPIILSLDEKGAKYLDKGGEHRVEIEDEASVLTWLKKHGVGKETTVYVRADRALIWERVLECMTMMQRLGWHKVTLVTEAESVKR